VGYPKVFPRISRRDALTMLNSKLFSEAIYNQDYERAALIAYYTTLSNYGFKGIMKALDNANSYIKRKKRRKGL